MFIFNSATETVLNACHSREPLITTAMTMKDYQYEVHTVQRRRHVESSIIAAKIHSMDPCFGCAHVALVMEREATIFIFVS